MIETAPMDFAPSTYHGLPVVVEIAAVDCGYVISIYSLLTGSPGRIGFGMAHDPTQAQRIFERWAGVPGRTLGRLLDDSGA